MVVPEWVSAEEVLDLSFMEHRRVACLATLAASHLLFFFFYLGAFLILFFKPVFVLTQKSVGLQSTLLLYLLGNRRYDSIFPLLSHLRNPVVSPFPLSVLFRAHHV